MIIYTVVNREVSNSGCVIHSVKTFSLYALSQMYAENHCAQFGEVVKINDHYFAARCDNGYKESIIYVTILDKED